MDAAFDELGCNEIIDFQLFMSAMQCDDCDLRQGHCRHITLDDSGRKRFVFPKCTIPPPALSPPSPSSYILAL